MIFPRKYAHWCFTNTNLKQRKVRKMSGRSCSSFDNDKSLTQFISYTHYYDKHGFNHYILVKSNESVKKKFFYDIF